MITLWKDVFKRKMRIAFGEREFFLKDEKYFNAATFVQKVWGSEKIGVTSHSEAEEVKLPKTIRQMVSLLGAEA